MKRGQDSRPFLVALCATTLLGVLLCTDRLFGVHGVESALVLGAIVPLFAAVVGALTVLRCRFQHDTIPAGELLWRAISQGWMLLASPVTLLAVNALRVRNCTPGEGLAYIFLGPVMGTTLASVCGVAAGLMATRRTTAIALALGAPLACIAIACAHFYGTPGIFAYSHFFGYFPGTLYDEALTLPSELLSLRALTTCWIVGLGCLVIAHHDPVTQRLRWSPRIHLRGGISAMVAIGVALAGEWNAVPLGHRTTTEWIHARLGRSLDGARCTVVVPRELDITESMRLRDDCDFRVTQMERRIGVTQPTRVTAYFFRSPVEKRALMGAATTYIAKPWRNEVYLQLSGWPHPVLAHEIAHIVAGNLVAGPFRVASRYGGLWPEAALIEGLAVAAAWTAHDDLTPHQWARAMVELGVAPRVVDLLGLGFLSQPKERAYTVAGSLLRYIGDSRGPHAVRAIYRDGSLQSLGITIGALETEWLGYISNVPLPPAALALARQRFSRGSIFSSVCPRHVANLRSQIQADLAASDTYTAAASCRALLSIDPADAWGRSTLVAALARAGAIDDAHQALRALHEDTTLPPPALWSAMHAVADAHARAGTMNRASALYRQLAAEPQTDDALRLLEVKQLAADAPANESQILFDLLVGATGSGADPATAVHLSRALADIRGDGLGAYLEGRQLYNAQRFALASRLLDNARIAGLPTARLDAAALRLQATSVFTEGDLAHSEALWRSFEGHGTTAQRAEALDWLQRIRWRREHAPVGDGDGKERRIE